MAAAAATLLSAAATAAVVPVPSLAGAPSFAAEGSVTHEEGEPRAEEAEEEEEQLGVGGEKGPTRMDWSCGREEENHKITKGKISNLLLYYEVIPTFFFHLNLFYHQTFQGVDFI